MDPIDECAIFMVKFILVDDVKELDSQHIFHGTCIERWIASNNNCPVYRGINTICQRSFPKDSQAIDSIPINRFFSRLIDRRKHP